MGAPELLLQLAGRGVTVAPLPDGRLKVAPAAVLTDEDRAAIRTHRAELLALLAGELSPSSTPAATSCATCAHSTPAHTCAEPVAAGLAPRFRVVFLAGIGNHGASCPAWRLEASSPAPAGCASAPKLTEQQREALTGWTAEEIEQAGRYVAQLTQRGLDSETVERTTERLVLRDREGDERRLCLECSHLSPAGRCGAAAHGALRNADRRLEPLPLVLQRCEGFRPSL